jgi:hypothetical protein
MALYSILPAEFCERVTRMGCSVISTTPARMNGSCLVCCGASAARMAPRPGLSSSHRCKDSLSEYPNSDSGKVQ